MTRFLFRLFWLAALLLTPVHAEDYPGVGPKAVAGRTLHIGFDEAAFSSIISSGLQALSAR